MNIRGYAIGPQLNYEDFRAISETEAAVVKAQAEFAQAETEAAQAKGEAVGIRVAQAGLTAQVQTELAEVKKRLEDAQKKATRPERNKALEDVQARKRPGDAWSGQTMQGIDDYVTTAAKDKLDAIQAEFNPMIAKVQAELDQVMAPVKAAQDKDWGAFFKATQAKTALKEAIEAAWSAKNKLFYIPEAQAKIETEAQGRTEIKSENDSVSPLDGQYAIRIINATEYSNKDLTYPQIKIIKHIFESTALNLSHLKCLQDPSEITFLAVNESHTIVGILYGYEEESRFFVRKVLVGQSFQEENYPKEIIESRLFLHALKKAQELRKRLFNTISFSWGTSNVEDAAAKATVFYTNLRKFGVDVSTHLSGWDDFRRTLSITMAPTSSFQSEKI